MKQIFNFRLLKRSYIEQIWRRPLESLSPGFQRLIGAVRILHLVIRDLMDGMLTLRAMGLVYTTILALVPLLAVSFSVLKGFGVHNQIEPMLLGLLQPLGDKGVEISSRIIGFVENTKAGVLGALGLGLLMFTVVSLLQKIERSFNYTWCVSHHRPFSQRFSGYITVVLIGPVLLFTALGVTASVSSISIIQGAMEIESIGFLLNFFGRLVPYVLVISAFTFVYVYVPNTRVKISSALVGAVVAGVLWETASWGFSSFVVNSAKYTAIYSAFATLIFFFIWLYVNWLILLIGCSIAFYYQNPAQRHLGSRVIRLSNRLRESLTLNIMALIGRAYHHSGSGVSVNDLAKQLNISVDLCCRIIQRLINSGIVLESSDIPALYVPAYDPSVMSLKDILSAVRKAGETSDLSYKSIKEDPVVAQLQLKIDQAISDSLEGKMLNDLSITKTGES